MNLTWFLVPFKLIIIWNYTWYTQYLFKFILTCISVVEEFFSVFWKIFKSKGAAFKLDVLYNGTCKRHESFQCTVLFWSEEPENVLNINKL